MTAVLSRVPVRRVAAAALVLGAGAALYAFTHRAAAQASVEKPRVLVLGFDGADATLTQQYLAEKQLPNLARLAEQGAFAPLMPTNPAQSPVSWATISTGLGPGNHGIFDFLARSVDGPAGSGPSIQIGLVDVGESPVLSRASRGGLVFALGALGCLIGAAGSWFVLGARNRAWRRGGRLQAAACLPAAILATTGMVALEWVPLKLPSVTNHRNGEPFWQTFDHAGVRCVALEAPVSFPADHMDHGACLAGLGVPDVAGTWGIFSIWTDDAELSATSETGGEGFFVPPGSQQFDMVLKGPKNPVPDKQRQAADLAEARRIEQTRRISYDMTQAGRRESETREALLRWTRNLTATLPVRIERGSRATVTLQDGSEVVLEEGKWTDLLPVKFAANPLLHVAARVQLCLAEAGAAGDGKGSWRPFRIFVAPVQFDPLDVPPNLPLSSPHGFAGDIADDIGPYSTLGWPELTGPVKDDWLADSLFIDHTYRIMARREDKLKDRIARDDWDCLFAVFTETDRVQHAMWRHIDPLVPRYDAQQAELFGGEIPRIYREMDRIVGAAMEAVSKGRPTQVIVISDHGFAPFRRGVNLTNFLRAKGYQSVVGAGGAGGAGGAEVGQLFDKSTIWFKDVDWSRTVAYGMGLGNIYLNRKGREPSGIVTAEQAPAILASMSEDLLALRDVHGEKVVRHVYLGADIFKGERASEAPDLIVGFERGYRVSWQASLGNVERVDGMGVTADPAAGIITDNVFRWSGDHCSVDPELVKGIWFSSMPIATDREPRVEDVGPTVLGLFGLKPPATDGRDVHAKE